MDKSHSATAMRVGVGIDTARYGHFVSFVTEDLQQAAKGFVFVESPDGYAQLEQALRKIETRFDGNVQFALRIDAAGQYATNLEAFLRRLELPMTVSIGEPKRNRDYKNVHYPKRKADAVDSQACARFAAIEKPEPSAEVDAPMRRLREVCSAMSSQRKQTTRHINQLHNLMSRVFPELATLVSDLSAQWVLEMLSKYPSAARIGAARGLGNIRYLEQELAKQIQAAARTTVGSLKGEVGQCLVVQAVDNVRHSQQAERRLEKLLEAAYGELGEGGHRQLVTIGGIGKKTAAVLAAKIVSIERFASPEKLVGYFGIFPEENTSGVDKRGNPLPNRAMRMSRKGNDLVRGYLWMACQSAITHNPVLRALYARERAAGKRGDVALGRCMNKMIHLVFALWKTNQPFDPLYRQRQSDPPTQQPVETDTALQLTPSTQQSAMSTNELATRFESDHAAPVAAQQASASAPSELAVLDHRSAEREIKKAAGRKEALPPIRAVTAATNELVTRKLPPVAQPDKSIESSSPDRCAKAPWVDFAHLRNQITMQQVLFKLGVLDQLRGRGLQLRGACPIHGSAGNGGRPFSVHLGKNVFRCLNVACAKQGNTLDLWAAVKGLSLRQAAIDLAREFQLELAPQNAPNH